MPNVKPRVVAATFDKASGVLTLYSPTQGGRRIQPQLAKNLLKMDLDKVRVVGFDEDKDTLQGIQDGGVYGTVVQNPYRYGYESVRILAGLIKGDKSVLPKDNYLDIPARKITQANVAEFRQELDKLMAPSRETAADSPDRPTVAFVTNCIASFWVIGEKGARDAAKEFNVNLKMIMPPSGTVEEQTRMVEDALTKGVAGVAISPINPDNQTDLLNQIAEKAILITHDSDAPNSKRLCYVGMDNYQAGHMCGELVRDAMPNGGSSMLFVGRLEQLNAKLRNEGTIDAILGRERQTGAAIP